MPRDIPKQIRVRPFAVVAPIAPASAKAMTLSPEEVRDLVDGEQAFLADVHVSVTYSLYERAARQNLCDNILRKLDDKVPVTMLTNKEAGFVLSLQATGK